MAGGVERVRLFGMDVDGVLTDGGIYYGDGGLEIKRFHVHDGLGLSLLVASGVVPFIITGRTSVAVERRGSELGVREIHQGIHNKLACLRQIMAKYGVGAERVAYIGDDLLDLEVMAEVGFPIAAANARDEVKGSAKYVTSSVGGSGAVRDAIEWVLRLNGTWDAIVQAHARGGAAGGAPGGLGG